MNNVVRLTNDHNMFDMLPKTAAGYVDSRSVKRIFNPLFSIFFITALWFKPKKDISAKISVFWKNSFHSSANNPFAPSLTIEMHIVTIFAFPIGLAVAFPLIPDTIYPNGLSAELISRGTSLAKRFINAPGVNDGDFAPVEVTACRDNNFSGSCVVIRSFPGQCGR